MTCRGQVKAGRGEVIVGLWVTYIRRATHSAGLWVGELDLKRYERCGGRVAGSIVSLRKHTNHQSPKREPIVGGSGYIWRGREVRGF